MVLPNKIFLAALDGDTAIIEEWFSTGTRDANEPAENDATLMMVAALKGHLDIMRLLKARGADVNIAVNAQSSLFEAVLGGHHDAARLLLDYGAHIDAPSLSVGFTPLMVAAWKGWCNVVRLLLHRGADIACFNHRSCPFPHPVAISLVEDVVRAGSWKAYLRSPRVRLLALRHFAERGRATPPSGDVLERLFVDVSAAAGGRRRSKRASGLRRTALPKGVFWHVLAFWPSDRDGYDPSASYPAGSRPATPHGLSGYTSWRSSSAS